MNKLLVLAGVVALMSACTGLSNTSGGNTASMGAGAAEAADLGYHGPVHRGHRQYGN
jgi:hypothetical protein